MKRTFIINTEGLTVYYDSDIMSQIERKLGALSSEKYKVLKNALNQTASQAKKDLVEKAKKEYTVKSGAASQRKKNIDVQRATNSHPDATIVAKGTTLDLKSSFKTTAPKTGAKAQVTQSGALKLIQSQRGTKAKAFLTTFSSKHTAIVQRQDGKQYGKGASERIAKWGTGADMTAIKSLLSISFPKMVGGEKVYGALAPEIYENLMENLQKEIRKVLEA